MTYQDTLNHIRTGAEVLFIALVVGWWGCHRKATPPVPGPLPPQIAERISVDTRHKEVFVQTHKNTTLQTGVRHAQIDIDQNGVVTVRDRMYGFSFEPALTLGTDGFHPRGGVDVQYFYYRHFGAVVGVSLPLVNAFRLTDVHVPLGLAYTLPFRLTPNTSVYVASNVFSFLRSYDIGIRVGF